MLSVEKDTCLLCFRQLLYNCRNEINDEAIMYYYAHSKIVPVTNWLIIQKLSNHIDPVLSTDVLF